MRPATALGPQPLESTFTGGIAKIVVVRTDPGYKDDPGHKGTGRIVATFCE